MAIYFMPRNHQTRRNILKREELNSIDALSNICTKIENMTSLLEIPAAEFDARRSVCAELQELLRKYYPDCLLLTFGSSINGFGIENSDLDLLFLPFPEYCNLDYVTNESEKVPVPKPSSILTGESSRDLLSKLDEVSHLKFIRNILKNEKKLVSQTNLFPYANLKISFVNKIVCDLCASNRLVVFNSELLNFFQKLDARVKPLVLILRYWAHALGFIKRTFFTSYAFILLVIFFLQNTSPPVIPSVQHLVEISGFSRMTAGWQTAFATDVNFIPKSKNTETTTELLMHFFQFYWNFDFIQYIVSPYKGTPLPIKDIKNSEDKRIAGFSLVAINIQDLFMLSHNICSCKGRHNMFKMAVFTAYQMLLDKNEKFKFSTLFDPLEYDKIFDLHYESYLLGKEKIFSIIMDYECLANVCKGSKNVQLWYDKTCQALFDVLQYGLLMECEVIDKICWEGKISSMSKDNDIESKSGMPVIDLKEKSNVKNTPFELNLLLSLQCVVYSRTWRGREHYTRVPEIEDEFQEFSHPILKAEYDISKAMLERNPLLHSPVPLLHFKCELHKHNTSQIPGIIIILRPLTSSKEFLKVSTFINSFVPKTVRKILSSDK